MELLDIIPIAFVVLLVLILAKYGIKTIRPTERAVVERLGKYTRYKSSGLIFIIPGLEKLYMLNITEQMTDVERQEIITKDNLNAMVSAQVYHKILDGEETLKKAFYNVQNVNRQIVALAQTTMRNVIGGKEFSVVNSDRKSLNDEIKSQIAKQIGDWGMEVVRVELKEIVPPQVVQETMNNVIQAQNKKQAAKDLADAVALQADGERQAAIKVSEGEQQAQINKAIGEAQAIKTVADAEAYRIKTVLTATRENFIENAILSRQFDVNENALMNNTKIIFTDKNSPAPMIVISDKEGETIVPIPKPKTLESKR